MLNELSIKIILLDYLLREKLKNRIIALEVPYMYRKRQVDVLLIFQNKIHAFEIKSDHDSLKRLHPQAKDYLNTFNYTSIVIGDKFLNDSGLKNISKHFGLIHINSKTKEVHELKKPKENLRLKKYNLSCFIPKKNIIAKLKDKNIATSNNIPIEEARKNFLRKLTTKEIRRLAYEALKNKYQKNYNLFRDEIGKKVHQEDLRLLTEKNIPLKII